MAKTSKVSTVERTTLININSPASMAKLAKDLKEFVVKQKLFSKIQDKNYVNVEGWQFAGASLGVYPVVQSVERIEVPEPPKGMVKDEIRYRASVDLIKIADGTKVGSAVAICSNKESKRNNADEYVIASMAQTRAVGKAFRLSLGWIMKLAGYEPVPTEEVEAIVVEEPQEQLDIEDVMYLVRTKLAAMTAAEKMKILKDHGGTINEKSIDDKGYLRIYKALKDAKRNDA